MNNLRSIVKSILKEETFISTDIADYFTIKEFDNRFEIRFTGKSTIDDFNDNYDEYDLIEYIYQYFDIDDSKTTLEKDSTYQDGYKMVGFSNRFNVNLDFWDTYTSEEVLKKFYYQLEGDEWHNGYTILYKN